MAIFFHNIYTPGGKKSGRACDIALPMSLVALPMSLILPCDIALPMSLIALPMSLPMSLVYARHAQASRLPLPTGNHHQGKMLASLHETLIKILDNGALFYLCLYIYSLIHRPRLNFIYIRCCCYLQCIS